MGTFILKRKLYSDDNKESDGWSTVGKIATGTAATLGTAALGLRLGRKGTFGPGFQNKVGKWYQSAGAKLSNSRSAALKGLGEGIGKQGSSARAQAYATNEINKLKESGTLKNMTEEAINSRRQEIYNKSFERNNNKFSSMVENIRKESTKQ